MSSAQPRSARDDEAAAIVRETRDVQDAVVSALVRYLELAERMREFEDTFSAQVLSAAGELFLLKTRRRQLEAELKRIQAKLDHGEYRDDDEIRRDVEAALEPQDLDDAGTDAVSGEPMAGDAAEFDAAARERIHRAFRRIVLPRVHSDTSDAGFSEFEVAYAAYRSRDYTLMEAFVIRYRDEIGVEEDGRLLTPARLTARLREYQAARKRLEDRLSVLRREATSAEITAPERTRRRMEEQGERFRQAIAEEAERLRRLQSRLESLAGTPAPYEGFEDG